MTFRLSFPNTQRGYIAFCWSAAHRTGVITILQSAHIPVSCSIHLEDAFCTPILRYWRGWGSLLCGSGVRITDRVIASHKVAFLCSAPHVAVAVDESLGLSLSFKREVAIISLAEGPALVELRTYSLCYLQERREEIAVRLARPSRLVNLVPFFDTVHQPLIQPH
jgi:hypothetical protein